MFGAHRGPLVQMDAELALGLTASNPAAASTIPLQHAVTHVWRPTGTIASSLAPPSGVDMQAGGLANLGMHQPMHMQQGVTDIDILPLPEFHPPHLQQSVDIGAANANVSALPHVFGNPLSQSMGASAFEDFSSSARALSRSTSYAESSNHARYAATATHGLPGLLGLDGDRELEPLQELEPLEPLTDEEVELLHRLLPNDQRQSKENASSLSPLQQVRKPYPNPFGEPIQEVKYDLSSKSQASGSMQPLGTVRFFKSPLQRSPYVLPALIPHESLIALGSGVQQGVGYASSSRPFSSNQPCTMDRPSYPHSGIFPAISQDIVQAASPGSVTVEDSLPHLSASTDKPMWVDVWKRSTNPISGIGGACLPTELFTAGPRQEQANGFPKRPRAKVRKSRKAAPSPAMQRLMAMPTMKKDTAQALVEQMATQRDKRIRSERGRRMNTRKMYGDIRNLLPSNAQEMQARLDNATTVMEMMKYIQFCQMQEKMLKEQLKQLQAAARSTTTTSPTDYSTTISLLQTPESSAVLTLATMPAIESDWRPSSLLGSNLTIDVTGKTCCLNVSAPQHRSSGLLDRFVSTLEDHHLKVFHMTIVTRELMVECSLLCEVNPHVELQRNNLHTALQNIVHSFASASPSQGGRA